MNSFVVCDKNGNLPAAEPPPSTCRTTKSSITSAAAGRALQVIERPIVWRHATSNGLALNPWGRELLPKVYLYEFNSPRESQFSSLFFAAPSSGSDFSVGLLVELLSEIKFTWHTMS